MKKIFFALAALVLAFTGCSLEEDAIQVSEKSPIKVVVNMDKPGFGEDTRAARQGWEANDQVIVALNYGSEIYTSGYIKLIYNVTDGKGAWTTEFWEYGGKTSSSDFIDNLYDKFVAEGSVKAAYFSSGVKSVGIPSLNITTNASDASLGECVMTCEDGTYSFADGVLTLDITMIPQVAQFTIRDLDVEGNWNIQIIGPANAYAGGSITSEGVKTRILDFPATSFVHDNDDDISIYAAPWQSKSDIPSILIEEIENSFEGDYTQLPYKFVIETPPYFFERSFPFKQVEFGGAVIMDGPYTKDENGDLKSTAIEWYDY